MVPREQLPSRIRTAGPVVLAGLAALLTIMTAAWAAGQSFPASSDRAVIIAAPDRLQADRHYRSGLAYGAQGRFAEAARELSAAVALNPADVDAQVSLAEADAELGRFDDAVAALQRALTLAPNHVDAHYDLSRIYLERRQLDLAWQHARAVERLNPAIAGTLIGPLERVSAPAR